MNLNEKGNLSLLVWQQFWTAQRLLKFSNSQRRISKLVDPFFGSVYICTQYAYVPMLYELSNVYPIHDCVATCHFRSHYAILKVEHKCANAKAMHTCWKKIHFSLFQAFLYVQHEKINGKISIN